MTAAAQKQLLKKALALPKKARLDLYKRLVKSLQSPPRKRKAVSGARVVAEQTAVYGLKKAPKKVKSVPRKAEALSKKEWNEAWMKELKLRAEEMETGADPGVPIEVIWADLRKLDQKKK